MISQISFSLHVCAVRLLRSIRPCLCPCLSHLTSPPLPQQRLNLSPRCLNNHFAASSTKICAAFRGPDTSRWHHWSWALTRQPAPKILLQRPAPHPLPSSRSSFYALTPPAPPSTTPPAVFIFHNPPSLPPPSHSSWPPPTAPQPPPSTAATPSSSLPLGGGGKASSPLQSLTISPGRAAIKL